MRPIAVTMGDPSGVGPEISVLAMTHNSRPANCVLVGDLKRLETAQKLLVETGRLSPSVRPIGSLVEVIDLGNVAAGLPWGANSAEAGRAGYEYVERAARAALAGDVAAVCTGPINKESWRLAGVPHTGHTEALAALAGSERFAMMLVNGGLRVIHLSTHTSLVEAVRQATTERALTCIELAAAFLRAAGIANCRIAVAGINPHAGEAGLLGSEDQEELRPAVEAARGVGIDASGPWPPDTVFARAILGEFDAVIAAYHDQGHIPIKMLGLDSGVNVTLGLPFIRTSVDHGTAFDIAGRGIVREANLLAALDLATSLAAANEI